MWDGADNNVWVARAPMPHRKLKGRAEQLLRDRTGKPRRIRLEKRMEALQRVKLDGFQMVISELEVEQDYLRRAMRYLEE
jgi:hypothetical protein